jgi:hypothetical protein
LLAELREEEALKPSQVTQSLSTLLDQVKGEETKSAVRKENLLSIANYVLNEYTYTKAEYRAAVAFLAKYHLWRLIDKRRPIRSRKLIEDERLKRYVWRCSRCGLPISSEKSLRTGLGRVCREKASLPNTSKETS